MPVINVYAGLGPILRVYQAGSVTFTPDPAAVSVVPDPAIPFDILGPAGLLLAAAGRRQSEASK
jgi:hypothetical protein